MNIDDKLKLMEGDYFYPYDLTLTTQAKRIGEIGWGGSGTVMQVYLSFILFHLRYRCDLTIIKVLSRTHADV